MDNGLDGTGEAKSQSLVDKSVVGHVLCVWCLGLQAGVLHLVLLPELVELVAVNGKLDEVQVIALDAEVEVPKPEHEAVWGWGSAGSVGRKSPTQILLHPQPSLQGTAGGCR